MNLLSETNKLTIKCMKGPLKDTDLYRLKQGSNGGSNLSYYVVNYVMTDGSGNKKYMTSLVYNEVYLITNLKDQSVIKSICPKSLVLVSLFPMFQLHEKVLQLIYNKLILPKITQLLLD